MKKQRHQFGENNEDQAFAMSPFGIELLQEYNKQTFASEEEAEIWIEKRLEEESKAQNPRAVITRLVPKTNEEIPPAKTSVEQIQSQRGQTRRLYDLLIKSGHPEIRGSVVFVIDEVVAWVERKSKTVSVLIPHEELTNIRLPFPKMMLEYELSDGMAGIYIVAIDDLHISAELFEWSHKFQRSEIVAHCDVILTPNGEYEDDTIIFRLHPRSPYSLKETRKEWRFRLFQGLLAIQFINTQTVEITDHEPYINPKLAKRPGTKPAKFKMLHLKPDHVRYENTSEPKEYQGIMPEHLRRGHWRHVENHPIAHLNGTFWIRDTVVGERKNGVVVKDYKVEPPSGN